MVVVEKREGMQGDALEATSLGLKTKLGLRPNSRDMAGLIYNERSLLLIGRTIE